MNVINLLCNYLCLFISQKENYLCLFSKVRFSLLYSLFSPVHSNFSGIYCFFTPSISLLLNPNFLSLLNFLHALSAATSAICLKQEYSKNRRNNINAKRLWSPNTFCFLYICVCVCVWTGYLITWWKTMLNTCIEAEKYSLEIVVLPLHSLILILPTWNTWIDSDGWLMPFIWVITTCRVTNKCQRGNR